MVHYCQHNCIEELSTDHQKILEKIDKLEEAIKENPINKERIKEFLDFTENFVEPHLQKEEKVLFPALEKKGIPREGGPIGMMLMEHETKRGYVRKLKEGFEENNEKKTRENAESLVVLLREHIFKEDNVLYPCARDVLSQDELAGLSYQCEKIKKDEVKS